MDVVAQLAPILRRADRSHRCLAPRLRHTLVQRRPNVGIVLCFAEQGEEQRSGRSRRRGGNFPQLEADGAKWVSVRRRRRDRRRQIDEHVYRQDGTIGPPTVDGGARYAGAVRHRFHGERGIAALFHQRGSRL